MEWTRPRGRERQSLVGASEAGSGRPSRLMRFLGRLASSANDACGRARQWLRVAWLGLQ